MLSYLELAFAWLLFISMPILAAGMFYRAGKYRSMREKALPDSGTGQGFDTSRRLQHYRIIINASGGIALCAVIAAVLLYGLAFTTWSGIAALIVWSYYVATLLLERKHATKPSLS